VARKRELKRNKKQRQFVRTAALKVKDPTTFIRELENLDEIEYDPMNTPTLTEMTLKDRRRKIKETMERVMRMYQKEDIDTYTEMKTAVIK
jgi:WW domain-binding protein 11